MFLNKLGSRKTGEGKMSAFCSFSLVNMLIVGQTPSASRTKLIFNNSLLMGLYSLKAIKLHYLFVSYSFYH